MNEVQPYDLQLISLIMEEYEDMLETLEVHNFYRPNPTYVPMFLDMVSLFPDSTPDEVIYIMHRMTEKYHIHIRPNPKMHCNIPVAEVW